MHVDDSTEVVATPVRDRKRKRKGRDKLFSNSKQLTASRMRQAEERRRRVEGFGGTVKALSKDFAKLPVIAVPRVAKGGGLCETSPSQCVTPLQQSIPLTIPECLEVRVLIVDIISLCALALAARYKKGEKLHAQSLCAPSWCS